MEGASVAAALIRTLPTRAARPLLVGSPLLGGKNMLPRLLTSSNKITNCNCISIIWGTAPPPSLSLTHTYTRAYAKRRMMTVFCPMRNDASTVIIHHEGGTELLWLQLV